METGNAERLVGLVKSHGSVGRLLRHGLTEPEIGLNPLAAEAQRSLGPESPPWYFSYALRIGVN